jgi:hypothetical protein
MNEITEEKTKRTNSQKKKMIGTCRHALFEEQNNCKVIEETHLLTLK